MQPDNAIAFDLDPRSGMPAYRQLAAQVRRAIRLGRVEAGYRLPAIREVVEMLAINPNTVIKAYQELEHQGLVETQHGRGTFVIGELPAPDLESSPLVAELRGWVEKARNAGWDAAGIRDLVEASLEKGEGYEGRRS